MEGVDRAEKLVQLHFSIVSIYKVLLVVEGGWTCQLRRRLDLSTIDLHGMRYHALSQKPISCSLMNTPSVQWLPSLLSGFYA